MQTVSLASACALEHSGEQVCRTQKQNRGQKEHKPGQCSSHSREGTVWGNCRNVVSGACLVANFTGRTVWRRQSVPNQWTSDAEAEGAVLQFRGGQWPSSLSREQRARVEADSRALGYRSHGSAELSLSAVGHAHGSLFISFSWEIKTVTPQIILAELAHLIKKTGIQYLVCRWLLLSARSKDKAEPKPNAVIPGDQQQAQGLGWGLQHTRKLFSLSLFLKTKPRLNNINMDRGQHRCRQRTCRQARTNTWSVWLPTSQTRLMIT